MAGKRKWYTLIIAGLIIVVITLVVMNEMSINQASELCREIGGTPQVEKDILAINWSFECDRS